MWTANHRMIRQCLYNSTNQNSGLADIVIVSEITASFSAVKVSFIKYISTILNEENQENY